MASSTTPHARSSNPSSGGSDPFASLGTNLLFQEGSRVQRLDLFYSLLCYGRSPLVLIGPPGAGKTTFLLQLQQRTGTLQPTALLTAYPELTIEPLLDEAQRQFTAVLAAGGLEKAASAILLVDDADTLSDVVLRVLITPVTRQEGQARVVLTGTPRLRERIQSFTDHSIPEVKIFDLLPFSEEDSARFVRTCMKAAGILNHPLLLPKALHQLYRKSEGWPGVIVTHARMALAPTALRSWKVSASPKSPPKTIFPLKSILPSFTRWRNTFLKSLRQAIHSYWLWPAMGVLTLGIFFGLRPREIPPPTAIPALSSLPPPPPIIPNIRSVKPVATPTAAIPSNLPPSSTTPASSLVTSPAVPSIQTPVSIKPTSQPLVPIVPPALPLQQEVAQEVTSTSNNSSKGLYSNQWIRAQRSTNYTLQLMSGNAEADLQEFLRRWELSGEIAITHTQRRGKNWYSLLYGVYSNYNEAQDAAKKLPPHMGKPWIRTLGSVQKDFR